MLSIFNRKRKYKDLSWIGVDMQSHVLPGLGDGATSVADSLSMLTQMQQLGIEQCYGTPHVYKRLYPNGVESITESYCAVVDALGGRNIQLRYAAKYRTDQDFETLLTQKYQPLLCLPGRHVLIDMSYTEESRNIDQIILSLQSMSYKPILAHPERYVFYHDAPQRIKRYKDRGCLLQINLLSMYGHYGLGEQKATEYLLSHGLVDLVRTGVCQERQIETLEHFVRKQDLSGFFRNNPLQNRALFNITS
jgi:protein-tyrosine phosphatase